MQQHTPHADDFVAFVGLDWADAYSREFHVLQHKPEAIDECVRTLRQRFQGKPIAMYLEACQVDAGLGHQGVQPGHEIQRAEPRLNNDVTDWSEAYCRTCIGKTVSSIGG